MAAPSNNPHGGGTATPQPRYQAGYRQLLACSDPDGWGMSAAPTRTPITHGSVMLGSILYALLGEEKCRRDQRRSREHRVLEHP